MAGGTRARHASWMEREAFKASAQPTAWEPIFAIAPGRRVTPMTLRAIAGAFSDGAPERLLLRAIVSGAGKELERLSKTGKHAILVA